MLEKFQDTNFSRENLALCPLNMRWKKDVYYGKNHFKRSPLKTKSCHFHKRNMSRWRKETILLSHQQKKKNCDFAILFSAGYFYCTIEKNASLLVKSKMYIKNKQLKENYKSLFKVMRCDIFVVVIFKLIKWNVWM